jgi:hypothetical protein
MGILERIGAEALGIRTTKPGRLLCGADLGDGVACRVYADHPHNHPNADDAAIAAGIDQVIKSDLAAALEADDLEAEALLKRADQMVPAKGLAETIARYPLGVSGAVAAGAMVGMGQAVRAAAQHEMDEAKDAVARGYVGGREDLAHAISTAEALGPESAVEIADRQRPLPEWSSEYKLRHVLARPSLARRLCEALEPPDAAELAEVLDGLFERRMTDVQRAVAEVTEETLARMHEDAQAKLREVRDERFGRSSRLH